MVERLLRALCAHCPLALRPDDADEVSCRIVRFVRHGAHLGACVGVDERETIVCPRAIDYVLQIHGAFEPDDPRRRTCMRLCFAVGGAQYRLARLFQWPLACDAAIAICPTLVEVHAHPLLFARLQRQPRAPCEAGELRTCRLRLAGVPPCSRVADEERPRAARAPARAPVGARGCRVAERADGDRAPHPARAADAPCAAPAAADGARPAGASAPRAAQPPVPPRELPAAAPRAAPASATRVEAPAAVRAPTAAVVPRAPPPCEPSARPGGAAPAAGVPPSATEGVARPAKRSVYDLESPSRLVDDTRMRELPPPIQTVVRCMLEARHRFRAESEQRILNLRRRVRELGTADEARLRAQQRLAAIMSPLPPSLRRIHALSDRDAAADVPIRECYTELDHEELQVIQLMVDVSSQGVRRRVKSAQRFSRCEDEQVFFEAVSAARADVRGFDRSIMFRNLWKCSEHVHEVLMWRAHCPTELAPMPIVPYASKRLSWVPESLFQFDFLARSTKGPREGVYLSTYLRPGVHRCNVADDATEALIVRAFVGNCHRGTAGLTHTDHSCAMGPEELVVFDPNHLLPAYLVQFDLGG